MEKIYLTGFSSEERLSAINRIQGVISKYGDLTDVHFFSDISLNMTIEIEELKIDKLYDELTKVIELRKFIYLNSNSANERIIYLNISFAKGSGNLKVEVPFVPG